MKRFRAMCTFLILLLLLACSSCHAQFPPPPGTGPGLPETVEAIDAARVTTRILYITAHPDDESAAVLTYLARGLHADVALLSVTRGEGGQNALGPEQAPQLGMIRTQELLAATRGYGVKLYFTRAKDFGFSKTPEETQKIWGDAVLEDMIRVIRAFRPNVVVNNFGGVHSGHGHHQTAGLWAPKAVQLAADASAFPDLLKEDLAPWKPDGKLPVILDVFRGDENGNALPMPLDDVSPLYGKSWREIGIDAFSNHRTQGIAAFLNSPFIRRPISLVPEDDQKFQASQLAGPITKLLGVPANLHVAYISAEGEPVPDALKRLGISVEMLDAPALNFGDLSHYSAIVVGVRAYELRPELAGANKRLLDYVSNGGTLVVQYNRDVTWDRLQPAPYPAKVGSPTPRITDETSPVKILRPDDPLLNHPNKITQADFQGWVQERGLYFWSDFDSRYTPLLAMNDPGEPDLTGGLVYAKFGKGTYIYTGIAFFRQLPEGVPGAYRLFVNLLNASQSK